MSPTRASLCLDTTRHTLEAERSLQERDVCLYVGVPFCPTRCSYCSFVSQSVEKSMKLIAPFVDALEQEIAATGEQARALGLRPVAVYFGGGTPTTLSPQQLERVCTALENSFDLGALREFTVEAGRPDTITEEKLEVLRAHGVDRVSVNPQTMSDTVLEAIGRRHSAADILTALETVRRVGGFSVNMDLIAGLPADSAAGFRSTLEQVLALSPENITVHTLSLKKGSRITTEGAALPGAEEVGAMLDFAAEASWRSCAASWPWAEAAPPSWCAMTADAICALSPPSTRWNTSAPSTVSAPPRKKSEAFIAGRIEAWPIR